MNTLYSLVSNLQEMARDLEEWADIVDSVAYGDRAEYTESTLNKWKIGIDSTVDDHLSRIQRNLSALLDK